MAYVSQDLKARLAPAIKAICEQHHVKATIAVRDRSTLVLNITESPLDFIGNAKATSAERTTQAAFRGAFEADYMQVNTYWLHEHFTGEVCEFLKSVKDAMNVGNHDRSDQRLDKPLQTIRTKDCFALVTVKGVEYAIVDIGMRMLTPRELFRAQSFADDYIIEHDVDGNPLTKTAQVRMCGNSVPPVVAEALVRANVTEGEQLSEVA